MHKFKVVQIDAAEGRGPKRSRRRRSVVVLEEIDVVSPCHKDGNVCIAGDPQKDETLLRSTERLEFLSAVHPREVELLPLMGRRVYYLPLRSDHYALDWACSFTGGEAEEDSPLDELEKDWARRYGVSEATNVDNDDGGVCNGPNEVKSTAVVAWSTDPEYCSDLFTPECKKVYTILEVLEKIQHDETNGGSSKLYPPMLGAIRVKSQLINLGDPDISGSLHMMYFDFVGVLSNVGKVCLGRNRKADDKGPRTTVYPVGEDDR